MKPYTINYKLYDADKVKTIIVLADNKVNAYDAAMYEEIPKLNDGALPYSAWVSGVTYNNGNYRSFNTFEGKPY